MSTHTEEKTKVYELDFGDTNVVSPSLDDIIGWIKTDIHEMKDGDQLDYKITIRRMTQKEIDELPEWA